MREIDHLSEKYFGSKKTQNRLKGKRKKKVSEYYSSRIFLLLTFIQEKKGMPKGLVFYGEHIFMEQKFEGKPSWKEECALIQTNMS